MFISVRFWPDFDEEIEKIKKNGGDKKIDDLRRGLAEDFTNQLHVTRNQIRTVFSREGANHLDVAFAIGLEKTRVHVEIFVFPINDIVPTEKDQIAVLFPLMEKAIVIPMRNSVRNPVCLDILETLTWATEATLRLAADFGREGLPAETKKRIAEIGRVFRNTIGPSSYLWIRT